MNQLYLIGRAPGYSLSPQLHSAACSAFNLPWEYKLLAVPEFAEAIDTLRSPGCIGANVTIPYKEECIRYLDELDPVAEQLGAVNTIVRRDKRLIGYNTDVVGLNRDLVRLGITTTGRKILILGAGGAAAAVLANLNSSATVTIVCRRQEQANDLAKRFKQAVEHIPWHTPELSEADLIFVCTPPGVWQRWSWPQKALIYNLNYLENDILHANYYSGLGMLVFQAAESFTLWSNRPAPVAAMAAAVNLPLTP
ncbi:MAG: hypothetical protein FH749_05555 [Firmicutes bacterium]|nr:hypothetical protein [Bacillota bacterium]